MTVLAISNRKGGTGKTTTAVNLGACLAELGRSVLLVDMDPQANTTTSLGATPAGEGEGVAALLAGAQLAEVTTATAMEGLELVASGPALAAFELERVADGARHSELKDRLARADHDFVIVDTPPAMGRLALNALTAADGVIVPLQCDYFSLEGLREFAANMQGIRAQFNPGLQLVGLLKTMYDDRTLLSRQVAAELARHFGSKVFPTAVPRNIRLAEAPSHGVPVILFDSGCKGAAAYRQVAKEFLAMQA